MTPTYDIIGLGNAIVDVIATCDDAFLLKMKIDKGVMQLVEQERGEALYEAMDSPVQTPGGSVANSMAGMGALGLKTCFIGKVNDDGLGQFYASEMEASGCHFPLAPQKLEQPTSRSMIFVSPDGERSMNTYLGAGADVDAEDVAQSFPNGKLLFLEGYLFDKDEGKAAFFEASTRIRAMGGKSALSLSDPFCVDRHRVDFQRLIAEGMDIVLGNADEWQSLYQTDTLDAALQMAAANCDIIVCTRSSKDVLILQDGAQIVIPVTPVTPVDTTGAGDQFAAGFLAGIAKGFDLDVAGRMGVICAAEVVGHIGPRPQVDTAALIKAAGMAL